MEYESTLLKSDGNVSPAKWFLRFLHFIVRLDTVGAISVLQVRIMKAFE